MRNPPETKINERDLVRRPVAGDVVWDALVMDYGSPIDLSISGIFRIRIRTEVAGTLLAKLEGGAAPSVVKSADVAEGNGWAEYLFDFSDQREKNHTKLIIFFTASVKNGAKNSYCIDDLYFAALTKMSHAA